MPTKVTLHMEELGRGCLKYFTAPAFFIETVKPALLVSEDLGMSPAMADNAVGVCWELLRDFMKTGGRFGRAHVLIGESDRQTRFVDYDEVDGFKKLSDDVYGKLRVTVEVVSMSFVMSMDGKRMDVEFDAP